MIRRMAAALALWIIATGFASQEQNTFTKNFKAFKGIVPGVDFYAGDRKAIEAFEKPLAETRAKMVEYLGGDLAQGAFVVCSSLEQKDAVTETRLLRMGYKWALINLTPDVQSQQRLAQLKAQMGDMIPPEVLQRFQNQTPEAKAAALARLASSAVPRFCYAVVMSTLSPEREFRSSRLDDMGRSPLADWLDIGLVSHFTGTITNLRFLQDRMDDAFPLEDILSMSRPFVAPSDTGSSGGGRGGFGGMRTGAGSGTRGNGGGGQRTGGGQMAGGFGGTTGGFGGGRGGGNQSLPKDVQDRMFFDAQASSFFAYLLDKVGAQKCKSLVQASRDGKEIRGMIFSKEMIGTDVEAVEKDWQAWVKARKPETPGNNPNVSSPGRPEPPGSLR